MRGIGGLFGSKVPLRSQLACLAGLLPFMEDADVLPASFKPDAFERPDPSAAVSPRGLGNRNLSSSGAGDDPPKKRRLMTPKARPKKLQEYLSRRLAAAGDDAGTDEAPAQSASRASGACASLAAFEASHPVGGDQQQRASELVANSPRDGVGGLEGLCAKPEETTETAGEVGLRSVSSGGEDVASSERRRNSLTLLEGPYLAVQRLSLESPGGERESERQKSALATPCLKSPPDKRPSSGSCPFGGDSSGLSDGFGEGADGGLGAPPAAVDFSAIPLGLRLQSKVVKQRIHGCEEAALRLGACKDAASRLKVWQETASPHLASLLKDSNPLVAAKILEVLQAFVGGVGDSGEAPRSEGCAAEALTAEASLQLLQVAAKQLLLHLIPHPRLSAEGTGLLLRLAERSQECLRELVSSAAACSHKILEERKGNVAAVKGQALRQLAGCLELLAQAAREFGSPAVVISGGVKAFVQPLAVFAASSDKRVRAALVAAAVACVASARRAGEGAASAARLAILELLKNSRSLQGEVECQVELLKEKPLPAPTRFIVSEKGTRESGAEAADLGRSSGNGVASLDASAFVGETDVIKAVCQQPGREWVTCVVDGKVGGGSGESEMAPWKVKLQAWKELEEVRLHSCRGLHACKNTCTSAFRLPP